MSKESDNERFVRDYQSVRGLAIDGWAGMITVSDLQKLKRETKPSIDIPMDQGFDSRTSGNISTLHPRMQPIATAFMRVIRSQLGDFRVTSGYRSYEEQDALYAQGRTKGGSIVTNARGGYSVHNFGGAFDITLFVDGQPKWESPLYATAGLIGERMGLDWAGGGIGEDFHDNPHYELPGSTDRVAIMRDRKAKGLDPIV